MEDIGLYQLDTDPSYCGHENIVRDKWENINIYQELDDKKDRDDGPIWRYMDGPPFVSGNLHMGHLAVGSMKSCILNWRRMRGYSCLNKMGYDCHGLPIENLVCKENNIGSSDEIKEMGIAAFNKLCDKTIDKYAESWTPIFKKMGRVANYNNVYMTRDTKCMETNWWVFKELWKKNLVYRGNKVMAYSYECQTPLSNFEASQNYMEKRSKSVYVKFALKGTLNKYFIAWTTTPWTLPANLSLCVNPEMKYVEVMGEGGECIYIIGKNSAKNIFGKKEKYKILREYSGSDLCGMEYVPIFNYMDFKGSRNYRVLCDNYVKDCAKESGTGIVHLAPAFGEDDFRVCERDGVIDNINISDYCPVDSGGKYTSVISDLDGILVFDANDTLIGRLKELGVLVKVQEILHNYPHCYRTDKPLIYRTVDSFFIRVSAIKERMLELNKKIKWYPQGIGDKRFDMWLRGAKDWGISRHRYYGTPIAIWENVNNPSDMLCIGSIAELEKLSGVESITNIHPEYIDNIVITVDGKKYKRVPDIFDCWFESGCVPYSQIHYPFENKHLLDGRDYLSDFICEGLDQTRGWFYTLLVISTAISDCPPSRSIMCTGIVLDKNGKKISKRLGNFVDPQEIIEQYGADYIRVYLISSPLVSANPLRFDTNMLKKIKQRFIPYINSVKFWIEHALNYKNKLVVSDCNDITTNPDRYNIMDRWAISKVNRIIGNVNKCMAEYQIGRAMDILMGFIDDITNWYVRFNRDRLKGKKGNDEREASLDVLYYVLIRYIIMLSPFTPFLSEYLFDHIKGVHNDFREFTSVHHTIYPTESHIDGEYSEMVVDGLRKISHMTRNLRDNTKMHKKSVVKLKKVFVRHDDIEYLSSMQKHIEIVKGEINCDEIIFSSLGDSIGYTLAPNKKNIGIKFRKESKKIIRALENIDSSKLENIYESGKLSVKIGNSIVNLDTNLYDVHRIPKGDINTGSTISMIEGNMMVSIDTTYDKDINADYQMRKLVSVIQRMRKQEGLRPWDKIKIFLDAKYGNGKIAEYLKANISNVSNISVGDALSDENMSELGKKYISSRFMWDGFGDECNKDGFVSIFYD